MDASPPPLRDPDAEHLKLLAIFHYVLGGLGFFAACFPLIHVALGTLMIVAPGAMGVEQPQAAPPKIVGFLFLGIGTVFVLLGWTMAVCTVISGRMIARRRRRTFTVVVAALLCMFMPLGTILGVFTLILLQKDSVKRLYLEEA